MHSWLIGLPPLVFAVLWVTFLGQEGRDPSDGEAWRRAFVKSALLCGAFVTASTELLSLFRAITGVGVAASWGIALAAGAAAYWRSNALPIARRWIRSRPWRVPFPDAAILVGLTAIVILTGLVAWVSPANTTDSHLYHMTRVMHWAQNRSLAHYPTTYEHQLWFPPWAETAILTLRVLWGSDQPAGLVQWLSYGGSLILVAGIAGLLGAGRRGRLLAATFYASIPMAVLQATSTQNDMAAAFWLLCLAYLILLASKRTRSWARPIQLGLALGLGIMTKTTFYIYAFPLVVWYLLKTGRAEGWVVSARLAGVAGVCAGVLNVGYWVRNWVTYGSPIGSKELVSGHTSLNSVGGLALGWAKHLLTNFATPSEALNRWIEALYLRLTAWLPQSASDFHLTWSWNHEDLAGSPIHFVAIGVVLLTLGAYRKRPRHSQWVAYAGAGSVGFALVTTLVSWNQYVVRLHLPFLVAMAPLVGAVVSSWLRPSRQVLLSGLLVFLSLPWLLFNQTRPAIGWRPRTAIVSVFRAEKVDILFANWLPKRDDFIAAVEVVSKKGCTQIGLRIDSHDLEYPCWWLLNAPQSGIRLEHIEPYPHLIRYVDPEFWPCAILCTTCSGRSQLHGMPRVAGFGEIEVFAGDGYTAVE